MAIGGDGTVVGTTNDETALKPVKWSPDSETATELDIGGHHHGEATDIPKDGDGRKLMSIKHFPSAPGVNVAGNSEAEAITGDWVLVSGSYRTKLTDPDKPQTLGVHPVALDELGRAYGHKGEALAGYGDELVKLPGLPNPPEPAEDDPDEPFNELLAVSADGGRIAGRTWDGDEVLRSSTVPSPTSRR